MKRTLPAVALAAAFTAAAFVAAPASAAPSRTTLTLACDRDTSAVARVTLWSSEGGRLDDIELTCGSEYSAAKRDRVPLAISAASVDVVWRVVPPDGSERLCPTTGAAVPFVEQCGPKQGGARLTVR